MHLYELDTQLLPRHANGSSFLTTNVIIEREKGICTNQIREESQNGNLNGPAPMEERSDSFYLALSFEEEGVLYEQASAGRVEETGGWALIEVQRRWYCRTT